MKLVFAFTATGLALAAVLAWPRPRPVPGPVAEPLPPTASQAPASAATTSAPVPSIAPSPTPAPPREKTSREIVVARLRQALADGDLDAIGRLRKELLDLITPPPVPDDKNGALVYQKAFGRLQSPGDEVDFAEALRQGRATFEQFAALEAFLAANAEGLALLKEAASFERFRFPVRLEDGFHAELPHVGQLLKAAKVLDIEIAVKEAKGLDAADSWKAMGKLADSVKGEPVLVSQLVRCLILGIGGESDPGSFRPILRDVMYAELAAAIHHGQAGMEWGTLALPDVRRMAECYLDFVVDAGELLVRPYHESHEALAALVKDWVDNPAPEAEGVPFPAPALTGIAESIATAEARCRPAIDPFTGNAFLERNGVIYSPGPDLVDDGGDPEKDVVLKPRPAK